MSAAAQRRLLRTSLLSLIVADIYAGVSLLLNQLLGVSDVWSWSISLAPALTAFGLLRHWSGSLLAPILFHGACNVLGDTLYFGYFG